MKTMYCMGIVCLITCWECSCKNPATNMARLLQKDSTHFVDPVYYSATPLVELINMPAYTERAQSFTITAPTQDVQVYATGEILYNLSDADKQYYCEGDDIELSFGSLVDDSLPSLHQFVFSYGDDKKKGIPPGVVFKWKNVQDNQFVSEIKIPWSSMNMAGPEANRPIGFNITIGDNDDGLVQKAKLTWRSGPDAIKNKTGEWGVLFIGNNKSNTLAQEVHFDTSVIQAKYITPNIDGVMDTAWLNTASTAITHIVYGYVKDKYDLSASLRAAYDDSALYLLVTVNDSRQKKLYLKRLKERNLFVDYGWIENEKGEKLWEMEPLHSRHAGGAYRNQKADTILHLAQGKYTVKYVSDESHGYNSWNEPAPHTPFYGIVVYPQKNK